MTNRMEIHLTWHPSLSCRRRNDLDRSRLIHRRKVWELKSCSSCFYWARTWDWAFWLVLAFLWSVWGSSRSHLCSRSRWGSWNTFERTCHSIAAGTRIVYSFWKSSCCSSLWMACRHFCDMRTQWEPKEANSSLKTMKTKHYDQKRFFKWA